MRVKADFPGKGLKHSERIVVACMPGTILTGISSTGMLWLRASRASVSWTLVSQLVDFVGIVGVAVAITFVVTSTSGDIATTILTCIYIYTVYTYIYI